MKDISLLKDALDKSIYGGKASNLAKMLQNDLPVPIGFAIGIKAFEDSGRLSKYAREQIYKFLDDNKLYAVRSSALAEDAKNESWAGQFETFLDTSKDDVMDKIEECHNSAKERAKAYSKDKDTTDFQIAVVVQEMLNPKYAGVLFTKDPITGANKLVTEYVEGLGEELVSGRADPKQIAWLPDEEVVAPFDIVKLTDLAQKIEQVFGSPQDIEWAYADNKMWLVQTRPITVTQTTGRGYYLGEPQDLFYWGPSRAKPMYMSDFIAAAEQFFIEMAHDPDMPNPPKTLVLFWENKMVWLNNAEAFQTFTEKTFEAYEKRNQLDEDIANWRKVTQNLINLEGVDFATAIVRAWKYTEFAEFSLYGAESSLSKRFSRFDAQTRQDIWGAFTVPDNSTFLARIDKELQSSKDPKALASKYPWIQDGYEGVPNSAVSYFTERLKVVSEDILDDEGSKKDRKELAKQLELSDDEVRLLTLTRKLAEFMDDRKAWMMQTRRLITKTIGDVEFGWLFNNGTVQKINEDDTKELWQRYVDFRSSSNTVKGIVASNGGKHFINGEVVVVSSPTDRVNSNRILVVPSTSPSYVPLMRKAKALITDHGGMMSHAAIVAREFGLPCIVGTKQATKVLEDGDQVILDLSKGEILT